MRIDAALNLLWAALALGALGALAAAEWRRRLERGVRARGRRVLAVFLMAVALFPSISASDDFVHYRQLQARVASETRWSAPAALPSNDKPSLYLARLADALESLQISTAVGLPALLAFFALVWLTTASAVERELLSPTSRAPPRFASLG